MPSHGTAYFVGRAEELERLGAAYEVILGGRTLTVLVSGDAGIGKSRLVEEFSDRVRLQGAVVATGMCVPGDAALPYAPVVGILRDLTRQSDAAPAQELLRTLCGGTPDEDNDAVQRTNGVFARTMLFEAILQLVLDVSQHAPFTIIVEDLQWCDAASAQLLDFLVRNLGDARVLIIGTYRGEDFDADHPLAEWLAELSRNRRTSHLTLGGLGRLELTALLVDATGTSLDPPTFENVWTRSQGNPFFAEELATAGSDASLPAALKGVALTRVRQVSQQCRDVLAVAATAGASVEHDLLEVVCGPRERLADILAEALDRRILLIEADGVTYRFRHGLLREAVYGDLLPARRRALHRDIATALAADERIGPKNPVHRSAALAGHWWSAEEWHAALLPSIAAAEAAAGVFAFREAYAHLEHALLAMDNVDQPPEGVTRLAVLERAAEYSYFTPGAGRAAQLAQAAVTEALAVGDPFAAARSYIRLGRSIWGTGGAAAAFEAYRAAADVLPKGAPVREHAYVLAEEARGHMLLSHFGEGEKRAREAIAAAEAAGARDLVGHATNTLGCCRGELGRADEGIELIREALVIAEELGNPEDLNRAYANLSSLLFESGRIAEAAAVALDAAAMGEQIGGIRLNTAASNSIEALMFLGRWDEAETMLEQLGMSPYGACVASPYLDRLPFATHRGRYADAENLLRTAHELTDGLGDTQFRGRVELAEATLALERGRPLDALPAIERCLDVVRGSEDEFYVPELAAVACRAAADAALAVRLGDGDATALARCADEADAQVEVVIARRAKRGVPLPIHGLAFVAQARAERSRMQRTDAQAWREAGDAFADVPSVYWTAYCRWREAEALLEGRGSRARAMECLSAAYADVRRLALPPFMRRIEDLATRSRIELAAGTPVPADVQAERAAELGLTAREVEILGQLAAGRTDREIAEALFISKKTVGVHVSNVLRKLQVGNRVEAGRIGQSQGLQPAPT